MKLNKRILCFIVMSLTAFNLCGCNGTETETEELVYYNNADLEEESYVLENDKYLFTLDTATTNFSITQKDTGYTWYSNAQDTDSDAIASNPVKKALNSTMSLVYTTSTAATVTIDNFASSIENGLYTITSDGKSIRVDYTVGSGLEKVFLIPKAVPESRMLEFYDKMERKEQKKVDQYYRVIDINHLLSTDNKDELLAKYPDLATEKVYVLSEKTQEYLKVKLEGFFTAVGYTAEDYELDIARYEGEAGDEKAAFNIAMIYTLNDDGFSVSVPLNEVEYSQSYPITKLSLLANFGAAGTSTDGFMLVPDGNGGKINFNNGKTGQAAYFNSVYGWDYGTNRKALVTEDTVMFPVFGMSRDDNSFICVLEDGKAYANIEADVSGKFSSYNTVGASYVMIHSEDRDVTAKSDKTVRVFEKALPDENITQRYILSDESGYVKMAESYRNYLMDKYPTLKKTDQTALPTSVEIIGAVDASKHILGVPAQLPDAMTTYKEALALVQDLDNAGFKDYSVKYNGALNGGVVHKVPEKASTTMALGSSGDLKKLVSYVNEQGNDFYFESDFSFINKNGPFDGFIVNRDTTKYVSREIAAQYPFWNVTFAQDDENSSKFYFARPEYSLGLVDKFASAIGKYGTANVAFGDIGKILGADYNPKVAVTRQQALNMQAAELEKLDAAGTKSMVYCGNDYVLPYVDFITDMKLDNNDVNIVDEEIPFYSIAIHGLVPYAGNPINMSPDYDKNVLKTLETGAGISFMFMDEPSLSLQDGDFTKYYSVDYNLWKDSAAELYGELSSKLDGLANQYITNHEQLTKGVYQTTFEDGTKITVNYNYVDYSDSGLNVSARGYYVERG